MHWTCVLQYSCQELSINGEQQTVQKQVLESHGLVFVLLVKGKGWDTKIKVHISCCAFSVQSFAQADT